ncbi:ImmA/IrrE family metallo-endopeptidase [Thermoanaerobacterium sp. DL9XJH110]|uniref:ImmA/IrrE family metallo-endopeptidase n=1 Tax=Thermoanaerobacterium sp. DL9XJH110 TaxID=3386643 RepID=UPI003BB6BB91
MYLNMAEKANQLLQKYQVKDFPVPTDIIEQIIYSEGISIEITKYLKKSLYHEDNGSKVIFIGHALKNSLYREYLLHETAHRYHYGNTALQDPIIVEKNEGQAKAFAAYFLMPIGVFESYLAKGESDYSLSQIFGVTQELVEFRKELSKSLIEGNIAITELSEEYENMLEN